MDVKAMARSKRSHTKHHQPRKPHRPTTQATPPSSSASKDPNVVKGEGEKKRSNLGSSLPSNWDRYHDSDEDEGLSGLDSASPTTSDLVKPKSKGADFGFLISQAKSQSPANFSDCFDGVLPGTFPLFHFSIRNLKLTLEFQFAIQLLNLVNLGRNF